MCLYILKNLFIPDIVQVLFKLYHAFFYFVHINIMDQLYYSNLLEQYFYFPNKRAKKLNITDGQAHPIR